MLQNVHEQLPCGCDNVSVCRFHYTNAYLNKPFNFASNMQYIMHNSIYRIGIKIITQAWLGERSEFCVWAMAKLEPSWATISQAISKWLLAGAKPSDVSFIPAGGQVHVRQCMVMYITVYGQRLVVVSHFWWHSPTLLCISLGWSSIDNIRLKICNIWMSRYNMHQCMFI
jgi:hypothetical protein